MALARNGRIVAAARGVVRGTIAVGPKGTAGFGYDPIFYYHPRGKTFAELSPEEKNAVSHRGRALAAMKVRLRRFLLEIKRRPSPSGKGRRRRYSARVEGAPDLKRSTGP